MLYKSLKEPAYAFRTAVAHSRLHFRPVLMGNYSRYKNIK